MREPALRFFEINRLRHALHVWDGGGDVTLLCAHGFLDHGRTWDYVVEHLPPAWNVVAFDWRGHGRSEWIGRGGYYHFIDYVMDLDGVAAAARRGRLIVCGHSMGGMAAGLWAGARPDALDGLVLLEGLGPPAMAPEDAPARTERWLDEVARAHAAEPRPMTRADAEARLAASQPSLTAEQVAHLCRHGTREVAGGLAWRYDPLHRTPSPTPFSLAPAAAFWRRIRCPVALLEGETSPFRLMPDLAERAAAIPHARRVVVPGAGHMMHLEAPAAVAREIVALVES